MNGGRKLLSSKSARGVLTGGDEVLPLGSTRGIHQPSRRGLLLGTTPGATLEASRDMQHRKRNASKLMSLTLKLFQVHSNRFDLLSPVLGRPRPPPLLSCSSSPRRGGHTERPWYTHTPTAQVSTASWLRPVKGHMTTAAGTPCAHRCVARATPAWKNTRPRRVLATPRCAAKLGCTGSS